MLEFPTFDHYKNYIVYICNDYENDISVNYNVNGIRTETIIQKNFIYLPIHENQDNHIEVSIDFKNYDHNFRAIPFGIIRMFPAIQEKYFFTNIRIPHWLEQINGCERLQGKETNSFFINLDLNYNPNSSTWKTFRSLGSNKEVLLDNFRLGTPSFAYCNDSWMVGYYSPSTKKGWNSYRLKYRIHKDIHVNCSSITNTNNLYNYVMIGKKTIPMEKILIIKKINSITDWIYSFNQMLSITQASDVNK